MKGNWIEILKIQLDGVMTHTKLFEESLKNDLFGYANLHKHHAEEEFNSYLHMIYKYISVYKENPNISAVTPPQIELDGTTEKEKMIKGMELYENWEKSVCDKLEKYQEIEEVQDLICEVHQELKSIHLMQNDLLDGKYEELDQWLQRKWGG